jgi:hypothetical protein
MGMEANNGSRNKHSVPPLNAGTLEAASGSLRSAEVEKSFISLILDPNVVNLNPTSNCEA